MRRKLDLGWGIATKRRKKVNGALYGVPSSFVPFGSFLAILDFHLIETRSGVIYTVV